MKKKKTFFERRTKGEKILFAIVFVIFALYAISMLYPFLWTFMNSFKLKAEYNADKFAFPTAWLSQDNPIYALFSNYIEAWSKIKLNDSGVGIVGMFMNSIWYSVGSATVLVFFCSMTAYVVAKYKFYGRNFLYILCLAMMMIPIIGTLPATYKLYSDLGMIDSPLILLPMAGGFGGYFMILYATYKGISWTYAEAAIMDGANGYVIYFKIMMPQAFSAMFTLWLLTFISTWNDYTSPLLYLPSMPNLSTGLMQFEKETQYRPNWPIYYAGLLMMTLPIIILFSVFSEKIMTSVTTGGIKG